VSGDAAQVNDFQDPASPDNPLLEEFYYLDAGDNASIIPKKRHIPSAHERQPTW